MGGLAVNAWLSCIAFALVVACSHVTLVIPLESAVLSETWGDWQRAKSFADASFNLLPFPSSLQWLGDRTFTAIGVLGTPSSGWSTFSDSSPRNARALQRFRNRFGALSKRAPSAPFARDYTWNATVTLPVVVNITVTGDVWALPDVPSLRPVEDEAYRLRLRVVDGTSVAASITAATPIGVLRALATLLQLVVTHEGVAFVPSSVDVDDAPARPWRGLMVDVARRFHTVESLARTLDAMEFCKLNVLHLHLTDDQGWRVPVPAWPKLVENQQHYTAADLEGLVQLATDRAIRIVPEVDVPGHSGAALFAYPFLGQGTVPSKLETRFGEFSYCLDPTRDEVYAFLVDVMTAVRAIFPDTFFHVGSDEVHWSEFSAPQRAFMAARNIVGDHQLQVYFNQRFGALVQAAGGRVVGWRDALHDPAFPPGSIFQYWNSVGFGNDTINSAGLYLDYLPRSDQLWDTYPALTGSLGGEACMWSEWVEDNMDTRVWPTTLAAADVLWLQTRTNRSSINVRSTVMALSVSLEAIGLPHRAVYRTQIGALSRPGDDHSWTYADAVASMEEENDAVPPIMRSAVWNAVYTLVDLLQASPRGGSVAPLFDVADAARPDVGFLRALEWVLSRAIEERLNFRTSYATRLLMATLKNIVSTASVAGLPSAFSVMANDVSNTTAAWLAWVRAVQRNATSAELQSLREALSQKGLFSQSFPPSQVLVLNGLRNLRDWILNARLSAQNYGSRSDIDGDGFVDLKDIVSIVGAWGPNCLGHVGDVNDDTACDLMDIVSVLDSWKPPPRAA